jgi:RNA polymerase sigma-70 factor (ECF subfamily)
LLREVLDLPATEVAEALETTVAAVNRLLVDKYVAAFERADVAALRALSTEDAVLEMAPLAIWLRGRDDYARFVEHAFEMRGRDWRVCVTAANGQLAFGAYVATEAGATPSTRCRCSTSLRAASHTTWSFKIRSSSSASGSPPFSSSLERFLCGCAATAIPP